MDMKAKLSTPALTVKALAELEADLSHPAFYAQKVWSKNVSKFEYLPLQNITI